MPAAAAPEQIATEPAPTPTTSATRSGPGPAPVWAWAAIALITVGAAVLRLIHIGQVPPDPFYDAAVKSMTLSWHNFFFGAFEPGGSVSIDKPPVDLWLQVASVKLLGFNSTTLKLPEVFAGVAAVPLLFATVKRMWSAPAGIAAALALAVLPVEVITSRSDTMDGVMMALTVLALWLIVRACETGRYGWLLAGAAMLGVAFDVKLLESLVAVPGLALLAYLGLPGPRRRRLLQMGAAGVVYVAVALAWLTATLLVPAHDRPYAIGSTNGSAWNAAFVFNGTDRLGGKSPEPQQTVYQPGHSYPVATQSERDHIPIVPPSPTRLLARIGPLSGERLGLELLIALLLGVPALIAGVLADRRTMIETEARETDVVHEPGGGAKKANVFCAHSHKKHFFFRSAPTPGDPEPRMRLAVAVGLITVGSHGDRAVQRHDPPAPPLCGGLHTGGRRAARHRRGLGRIARPPRKDRESRAADRAGHRSRRDRLLRRAAVVRAHGGVVDSARGRDRRTRVRGACARARQRRSARSEGVGFMPPRSR